MGGRLLVVGVGEELEDTTVVTWEWLDGTGHLILTFRWSHKDELEYGMCENTAGAAKAASLINRLLSMPNRTLGFRVGRVAGGAWCLADVAA